MKMLNVGFSAARVVLGLSFSVLAVSGAAMADQPLPKTFVAHLRGDNEVPARDTLATGQFVAMINDDGTELRYRLIVANIANLTAAHIHLGAANVNGPFVAFLAGGFPPGGGRVAGVVGEGTITAANLTGPLLGAPLAYLVDAMRNGLAYVNAHTNDGVPPVNTGAGDFPGGEVRGQIEPRAP